MKKIQILGTGCSKCRKLTDNTRQAADELGLDYELEKVTAMEEIVKSGIMSTPGLAVDGRILSQGRLLSPEEIKKLLSPA
jgi:small redox-active disulfide protein 2